MGEFKIKSEYTPTGDQPEAIEKITEGLKKNYKYQTLLGVTGSGKTFTMANIIEKIQKPTLVLAHNKTLAASYARNSRNFFLIMRLNISYLIMIIISRRHMCLAVIHSLRRTHP